MAQVICKHLLTKITTSDQLKNRHIDSQNKSSYFNRTYDYIDSTLQHLSQHKEFGTYCTWEPPRLRCACTNLQYHQSLHCLYTDEGHS